MQLRVSDEQGYPVSTQSHRVATGADRFWVPIGTSASQYYLRVSTESQHQTVRLVKQ